MMSLCIAAAAVCCAVLIQTAACGRGGGSCAPDQSRNKSDNLPMKYWIESISELSYV
ncbi:hypothetical protein BURMUCF2_B0411 [Burkholderia multivorans CF2]|nr:hypothetical protein BURMUCF2_B0411 [Burkholderia multivorans CF2]